MGALSTTGKARLDTNGLGLHTPSRKERHLPGVGEGEFEGLQISSEVFHDGQVVWVLFPSNFGGTRVLRTATLGGSGIVERGRNRARVHDTYVACGVKLRDV